MQGPIRAGRPLRPLSGLGEDMGDPRRARTEPATDDVMRIEAMAEQAAAEATGIPQLLETEDPTAPVVGKETGINRLSYLYGLKPVLAVPCPATNISITNRLIGTVAVKVDVGVSKRTYIHFANMSNSVIWVNTSRAVVSGTLGYPLAPNTAPGAYNGSTIGFDASERVEWYALAAAGAANMLLVVEMSRS